MAELNYRPNAAARALAERRSNIVGVVLPAFSNPYFGNIVEALREPCHDRGLTPLVAFSQESPKIEAEAIDHFIQTGVAAVIVVAPIQAPESLRRVAEDIPLVVAAREPMGGYIDTITSANRTGAKIATQHALDVGYERVIYVGRTHPVDGSVSSRRELGYLDALAQAGRIDEALTVLTKEAVGQTLEEVFDEVGSTNCCFVVVNDMLAIEIVAELGLRGIQPGLEVGVIGYDNTYLAGLHGFQITSMDPNYAATAEAILEAVTERIHQPDLDGRHRTITPHLVKRASSRRHTWGTHAARRRTSQG
nr:LacI family DNA-binding transcriptional regulator [Nanchangia anserum]